MLFSKRILLCILLSVSLSYLSEAQISVGYGYGTRFSQAFVRALIYQSPLQSNLGLVSFEIKTEKMMSSRIEFGLSTMGWKETFEAGTYQSVQLNTLELPFLGQMEIGKGLFRVLLQAGLTGNYALSGTQTVPQNKEFADTEYDITDINFETDNFNRTFASIGGGGGFRFSTKYGMLSAEVRVSHALIDLHKSYSGYNANFTNIQSLSAMVYFHYPLIKFKPKE